jgi:hypothetical protein
MNNVKYGYFNAIVYNANLVLPNPQNKFINPVQSLLIYLIIAYY